MRVRRLRKHAAHLEITAFINLIVVLVPFLLSTAVFSRLAVLDLTLPAQTSGAMRTSGDKLQLEVVLRADAIEVGDRVGGLIQRIPRGGDGAELRELAALMLQLKARFPAQSEATLLAEPATPYDRMVQAMDAIRAAPPARGQLVVGAELFPNISIGDAPLRAAR